ncbi:peptidyl-prolyl cis-trans isomerase, cyclophilin type [Thalassoporum mexicanum PCC 7367]|uniref:calcium-binding protein n=1 Tax=Thalassoporum mexicanum TaxID=3457544 RepID=UPI00029F8C57|nr:calcium-binding protein [Pseudanabaena sp. PCC 7367]AFY70204.1 peptidyl-prolyl cis-trans isomerase, cyclophilin type [Pseudanabaena sp. PCC 7367]
MVNITFLGGTISDDNNGNINFSAPIIHPSVGTIPAAPPTPVALYTEPNPDFTGLNLFNYLFTITQGAAVVPNESAFRDFTNNNDTENVPTWSGFGPVQSGGIRALNGNDVVFGSIDNDVVNGNRGSDQLTGSNGYDYLRGGRDNDFVFGDSGNDIVNGNRDNDQVSGGSGNDFVRGGQGNDLLFGNNGSDVLVGDFGSDSLQGGGGADAFILRADVLAANAQAADRILDFSSGAGDYIIIAGASRFTVGLSDTTNIAGAATNDTIISFNGQILGVVLDTNQANVFNNLFSVAIDSPLVTSVG